jgi:hypothetical protein
MNKIEMKEKIIEVVKTEEKIMKRIMKIKNGEREKESYKKLTVSMILGLINIWDIELEKGDDVDEEGFKIAQETFNELIK